MNQMSYYYTNFWMNGWMNNSAGMKVFKSRLNEFIIMNVISVYHIRNIRYVDLFEVCV